ncbi:O-antigen ligase domain-containing protein [Xylanibacillus composti]|uniref:O-antigen ligase-related domain-containing protein n=1 Tax=Xylanibacillus composti TaxID=1572762 RepID=A0A8J4H5A0_9BACL|nr:O-antigen ligase family protein [Xylanibacillus composti]MDT9724503.1 O-antigen ligase domain-containing protein [Xylanibacillus composti]GIQ69766.1 hypothetical protein XYCOK13_25900 [Xylanibacillus composti]
MRSKRVSVLQWFCFFYPFLIYPWGQGDYYTNVKAYYLIGFVILLGWMHVWSLLTQYKYGKLKPKPMEWLMVALLLLIGFSTLNSDYPSLIGDRTQHQGIVIMGTYVALFMHASRMSVLDQSKVLQYMAASSLVCACYGIAQYYGFAIFPQDHMNHHFANRSFSFFDNPDYFGSYLVMASLLAFTFFLMAAKKSAAFMYLLLFGILIAASLHSETRSAWVGIAAGLSVFLLLFARTRKGLWKKGMLGIVTLFLVLIVLNGLSQNTYWERAQSIWHDTHIIVADADRNWAGASRWYIWQTAIPLIEAYFWTGSGPNTFQHVFHPGVDPDYSTYIRTPIHDMNNDYLQIALTMGVPALLLYLLILGMVFKKGVQKVRTSEGANQIFHCGLLASTAGYLIQAVFNISVVSVAPFFWIIFGFLYSETKVTGVKRMEG